jgi:hypothetical protein
MACQSITKCKDLRLPVEPSHIECLIIPTFKEQIRGSLWYLKDGKPSKKSIVILISKQSKVQMILHLKSGLSSLQTPLEENHYLI